MYACLRLNLVRFQRCLIHTLLGCQTFWIKSTAIGWRLESKTSGVAPFIKKKSYEQAKWVKKSLTSYWSFFQVNIFLRPLTSGFIEIFRKKIESTTSTSHSPSNLEFRSSAAPRPRHFLRFYRFSSILRVARKSFSFSFPPPTRTPASHSCFNLCVCRVPLKLNDSIIKFHKECSFHEQPWKTKRAREMMKKEEVEEEENDENKQGLFGFLLQLGLTVIFWAENLINALSTRFSSIETLLK